MVSFIVLREPWSRRKNHRAGFYLGIGGVLTFKKSGLDAVVQAIGNEFLVLETDAPTSRRFLSAASEMNLPI